MAEAEETQPIESESSAEQHDSLPPRWRRPLILALLVLIAVSIGVRMTRARSAKSAEAAQPSENARSGNTGLTGNSVLPGGDGPAGDPNGVTADQPEKKPEGMDALLPFLTEGGVAMLLGIGFGMATRAIFKIFMIGVLILFAVIQYLSIKGILTVDWGAMGQWINDFVLNVKEKWGIAEIVQHKLPSAGSFGIGFYLGLKRG